MADLLDPGTMLHDRYTIVRVLWAGRQSVEYLGTDAGAAIKEVIIRENQDTSPEAQAAFEEEAQCLIRLDHPGLPVAMDYFAEPSGRQYLVSERIEGLNLGESLTRDGPLPQSDVLSWFDRLLAVVEYLHAQQPPVVHGSLSPHNIVIAVDGRPRLRILPGSPETRDPSEGASEPAVGPFLAPEQHQGLVNERADIYALGATLYSMLTGQNPPAAVARLAGDEMASPRHLSRAISPRVEATILKAMALEPEQRFRTPEELWTALKKPPASRSKVLPVVLAVGIGAVALVLVGLALSRLLMPLFTPQPPQPQPQATVAPAVISTVPPTATRPPTKVPTATPSVAPPTLTPTVTPTRPAPTRPVVVVPTEPPPTPAPRLYPAPALLSPSAGDSASGAIEFRWYWNDTLAPDEYFDLQVWRPGAAPAGITWCKEPFCRVSSLPDGAGEYRWRVQVIRGADGQVQETLSQPSGEASFYWRPAD